MDLIDDITEEQPLFETHSREMLATLPSDLETTDNDDDDDDDLGSSSFADHDNYANLNISSGLKNILSYDHLRRAGDTLIDDDSDSDADIGGQLLQGLDIDKLNQEIDRNKFANFPLMPPNEEEEQKGQKKKKTQRKPREKKKRRDKGKKKADILEEVANNRADNLQKVFSQFADEDSDKEDEGNTGKRKKKRAESKGRKSRKANDFATMVDENGETMKRAMDILDASSSESSEDERALSKKEELEMYREAERQRRAAKVGVTTLARSKILFTQESTENQKNGDNLGSEHKPVPVMDDDDYGDSDIEVVGNPKKLAAATAAAMLSPERPRVPVAVSPIRHGSAVLNHYNSSILSRLSNKSLEYRSQLQETVKTRGKYMTAAERAKRMIERERNSILISEQINMHFEKKKQMTTIASDEDDEEDEDYEETEYREEDEEDDDAIIETKILAELDSSEDEFLEEDSEEKETATHKRKISDSGSENEEDDGEDMAAMAFKRWKGKKVKNSIFDEDDDDDDEDGEKMAAKKVEEKSVPAHSIASFFKNKEAESIEESEEMDENKTLGRLVRREEKHNSKERDESEDEDAMDLDEPVRPSKTSMPLIALPKGPRRKTEYFEEEAEEEEDEFFGAGGSDDEDGEDLDEFEKDDLLVEDNNEEIDEAALREAFNLQDKESDNNMIQRLISDITSGNLRKKKAAAEAGLTLDEMDMLDEEDNDLVAIRRAAEARRRRMLKNSGVDILDNLLSNPKTSAFAKAAQAWLEETPVALLSDSEEEGDGDAEQGEEEKKTSASTETATETATETTTPIHTRRVIVEDDEEDEKDEDDSMDNASDEDEKLLIVDEIDTITSPLREGEGGVLASNLRITSADDESGGFQVETMKSPLNLRKTQPIFSSPGTLDRFRRLISDTGNALNGSSESGGPRMGFGATQQQNGEDEQEKTKTHGSLAGLFGKKQEDNTNASQRSKLSKLKSQSSNLF